MVEQSIVDHKINDGSNIWEPQSIINKSQNENEVSNEVSNKYMETSQSKEDYYDSRSQLYNSDFRIQNFLEYNGNFELQGLISGIYRSASSKTFLLLENGKLLTLSESGDIIEVFTSKKEGRARFLSTINKPKALIFAQGCYIFKVDLNSIFPIILTPRRKFEKEIVCLRALNDLDVIVCTYDKITIAGFKKDHEPIDFYLKDSEEVVGLLSKGGLRFLTFHINGMIVIREVRNKQIETVSNYQESSFEETGYFRCVEELDKDSFLVGSHNSIILYRIKNEQVQKITMKCGYKDIKCIKKLKISIFMCIYENGKTPSLHKINIHQQIEDMNNEIGYSLSVDEIEFSINESRHLEIFYSHQNKFFTNTLYDSSIVELSLPESNSNVQIQSESIESTKNSTQEN